MKKETVSIEIHENTSSDIADVLWQECKNLAFTQILDDQAKKIEELEGYIVNLQNAVETLQDYEMERLNQTNS